MAFFDAFLRGICFCRPRCVRRAIKLCGVPGAPITLSEYWSGLPTKARLLALTGACFPSIMGKLLRARNLSVMLLPTAENDEQFLKLVRSLMNQNILVLYVMTENGGPHIILVEKYHGTDDTFSIFDARILKKARVAVWTSEKLARSATLSVSFRKQTEKIAPGEFIARTGYSIPCLPHVN